MRPCRQLLPLALGWMLCALWAVLLIRGAAALPQVGGASAVALLLGDTRALLSRACLAKADLYFHSGVGHVGCRLHDHADQEHAGHIHHGDCDCAHGSRAASSRLSLDPWGWINGRLRVSEHRHLSGRSSIEVVPWLWSACRLDPANIAAYESGAYVLERLLGQPPEALALLREGIASNPASAELEIAVAELALRTLDDRHLAREALLAARAKASAPEDAPLQCEQLARALFYLGHLAQCEGAPEEARRYLEEARRKVPQEPATHHLERLLQ